MFATFLRIIYPGFFLMIVQIRVNISSLSPLWIIIVSNYTQSNPIKTTISPIVDDQIPWNPIKVPFKSSEIPANSMNTLIEISNKWQMGCRVSWRKEFQPWKEEKPCRLQISMNSWGEPPASFASKEAVSTSTNSAQGASLRKGRSDFMI